MAVLTVYLPERQEKPVPSLRWRRFAHALLAWRSHPHFGVLEGVVMGCYCALLAAVIPFHEPWGDEAQAWLIARDSSVSEMILHRLHYEGAPPLWHLLLHMFQLAGGRYGAIDWFGALFAVAGIFVMQRWSPFPLVIRLLLPFSFFLAYQYAVIARSYVLFPLLVFVLCALYGRRGKIIWFAVTAGLLANLSMQGSIVAWLFSALYLVDVACESGLRGLARWRGLKSGIAIFAVMAGIGTYTALPAPDINFIAGNATSGGLVHRAIAYVVGETPDLYKKPAPLDPWFPPDPDPPEPSFVHSPVQWTSWYINHRPELNELGDRAPQTFIQARMEDVLSFASQATWPLSTSNLLACAFLGLLAIWLRERGGLRLLVPWIALIVVGQVLWVTDHHVGMLLVTLLAAMWIGFERRPFSAESPVQLRMSAALALILALQVGWTIHCARADIRGSYDPGRETATFLKEHPVGITAGFHFWAVSVQPYFNRQPFYNERTQYWLWSRNADSDQYYRTVIAQRPDRIVYSVEFPGDGQMRNQWIQIGKIPTEEEKLTLPWDQLYAYFKLHGYRETHRFCGVRFARLKSSFVACDLILEPFGTDPLAKENLQYADSNDAE